MTRMIEAVFGAALFVGGLVLVMAGAMEPQRQSLAIAGAIILAAAYLGGPGSPSRRQPSGP
jgi:hypothetical protein